MEMIIKNMEEFMVENNNSTRHAPKEIDHYLSELSPENRKAYRI